MAKFLPRPELVNDGATTLIYEGARDIARQIARSWEGRTSRRLRKKIEMLFAHRKRILKLDRSRLRGPNGARDEFILAATAQNLRPLVGIDPGWLASGRSRAFDTRRQPSGQPRNYPARLASVRRDAFLEPVAGRELVENYDGQRKQQADARKQRDADELTYSSCASLRRNAFICVSGRYDFCSCYNHRKAPDKV